MTTGPKAEAYLRGTIIFQPQQVEGGWLPRCTVVYGLKGRKAEHVIQDEAPRATEQEADDTVRETAKRWIDQHNDEMTSFRWTPPADDESKGMWRELGGGHGGSY
jgi:hypothetical protein